MPQTVNGIGTTYYGKRNLQARPGICEHCQAETEISSYETRLWFVIFFVPVIPLGKKQIVDYCPACTRHRAVPLGQWKQFTEEAITEAAQKASQQPDDPESAMELHGTLVAFGRHEEAARVAEAMEARFPDNVEVRLHLGAWHAQAGDAEKADAHFDRALEIDPDHRAAARAVAIGCIEKGDLARARALLAFMETPGPQQDPAVLVLLADAYQAAGDHQSALAWYRIAIEGAPPLARDRKLRKRVKRSETALGRT